jgi:hypothetical protein
MGKLNNDKKIRKTYTKDMLIKRVAERCGKDLNSVRQFYYALEDDITKLLSSAASETDISIRLFEGITIDSAFIPEKTKINNLNGKLITTSSKVKAKANVTRCYCDKLTKYNEQSI